MKLQSIRETPISQAHFAQILRIVAFVLTNVATVVALSEILQGLTQG